MTDTQTKVLRDLAARSNDGVLRGPAFVAADTIDAQAARIAELEAAMEGMEGAMHLLLDMQPVLLATARADALRDAADVIGCLPTCSIGTAQEAILALIDKEPKP